MKYYILSIILHLLMFISIVVLSPNFYLKGDNNKNTFSEVNIKLENSIVENKKEENKSNNINKAIMSKNITENNIIDSSNNKNNIQIKNIKENNSLVKISNDNSNNNVIIENNTGIISKNINENGNNSSKTISSNGVKNIENINSNGNDSVKKEISCKEGIDFIVNYNSNLKYPLAVQRLNNIQGNIVVDVKLDILNNGDVKIVGISGGNKIFQDEVRKEVKKIKINIKNKEIINNCYIVKPFRFSR